MYDIIFLFYDTFNGSELAKMKKYIPTYLQKNGIDQRSVSQETVFEKSEISGVFNESIGSN